MIGQLSTSGTGLIASMHCRPALIPQGITVGPDGNIWFVGYGTERGGQDHARAGRSPAIR